MTIIEILEFYFVDLENTIQGFRWNHRRPRTAETALGRDHQTWTPQ